MSIIKNKNRIGCLSSSNAWKICTTDRKGDGFGKPALTYIQEKQIERKFGKSIEGNHYSQAAYWGLAMELILFNLLGTSYQILSQDTYTHPKYKWWVGSPDLLVMDKKTNTVQLVSEIKSYGLKNFALYSDCLLKKDVELFKKEFACEYWQIISNCIIQGADFGEAIAFAPYESQMDEIREYINDMEGAEHWKFRFIAERENYELSCIPDDCGYKNINKFSFIVPSEDKDYLTERMLQASKILLNTK